jgi:CRISPR-associated protein Cmr5
MLIKTNGLGATFAFVKSKLNNDKNKSGYAYKIIYEQTKEWLQNDNKHLVDLSNSKDLVFEIIKLNSTEYRAVTNEVLAFFNWLKRFADGLIEGESDNG